MSVSGIGSTPAALPVRQSPSTAQAQPASDGDSAAVEAAETAATKAAERQHGGVAPASGTAARPGGVNKLV